MARENSIGEFSEGLLGSRDRTYGCIVTALNMRGYMQGRRQPSRIGSDTGYRGGRGGEGGRSCHVAYHFIGNFSSNANFDIN